MEATTNYSSAACGHPALTDGLANSLPWHMGFRNEIADRLRPTGDWHPDVVRYQVVQVCAHDGRHVAWACSAEYAALIIEAVNKMANAQVQAGPAGVMAGIAPATES